MPKVAADHVTWFTPRTGQGQFRKTVGKTLGDDGIARPRVFYLGSDHTEAKRLAVAIVARWEALRAQGHRYWTPGEPEGFAGSQRAPEPGNGKAAALASASGKAERATVDPSSLTVRELRAAYVAFKKQQPDISAKRCRDAAQRSEHAAKALGLDRMLSDIGTDEVAKAVAHFKDRPKSERTGEKISAQTAKNIVQEMRSMLQWASNHADIPWTLPPNFAEVSRLPRSRMLSEAEREKAYHKRTGTLVETAPLDKLRRIFMAGDDLVKALILYALNTSAQNIDCGDLRVYEVREVKRGKAKRWIVDRDREKTGTPGRWLLWQETIDAMRKTQADPENELRRWWLTPTGEPLKGRETTNDYVYFAWRRACKKAKVEGVQFYRIRKTSADIVRQIAGVEVSEFHLAHREAWALSTYYTNPLYEKHEAATEEMRERTREVWDPEWKPPKKKTAKK